MLTYDSYIALTNPESNPMNASLSATEQLILQLFINMGSERYGKELVDNSGGQLKSRSIYVFLNRMEDKGFLRSKKKTSVAVTRGVPRKYYEVTAAGRRILDERTCIGLTDAC